MAEVRDEVSFSDYLTACKRLAQTAVALQHCEPDEAAEHHLPAMTRHTAIIFSFVGSNMTARHVPGYQQTVADLQAAKDGTLPHTPP